MGLALLRVALLLLPRDRLAHSPDVPVFDLTRMLQDSLSEDESLRILRQGMRLVSGLTLLVDDGRSAEHSAALRHVLRSWATRPGRAHRPLLLLTRQQADWLSTLRPSLDLPRSVPAHVQLIVVLPKTKISSGESVDGPHSMALQASRLQIIARLRYCCAEQIWERAVDCLPRRGLPQ